MSEVPIQALKDAIRGLHGCDSAFVEAVPVDELMAVSGPRVFGRKVEAEIVWQGVVSVFDLIGHPKARRCYAWSRETEGGKRRFYAVLALPPVASAVDAVRASIAADFHRRGA